MVLAADQLVGVGDPVHVGDALERAQVEVVEGVDVADQADDRADQALGDERLPADRLDARDDVRDVLVGGVGRHTTTMAANLGPAAAQAGRRTQSADRRYAVVTWRCRDAAQTVRCWTSPSIRAPRPQLDHEHRGQHHRPAEQHPRGQVLAAEQHREERREHRLHAHDDRGAGGGEVRLRPGLAERAPARRRPAPCRRSRASPGRCPAARCRPARWRPGRSTAITSSCTTDMPSASRAVDQAPSADDVQRVEHRGDEGERLAVPDREAVQGEHAEPGRGQRHRAPGRSR